MPDQNTLETVVVEDNRRRNLIIHLYVFGLTGDNYGKILSEIEQSAV